MSIEVKRVEKPQFKRWIEKLQDQTRPTQTPVLAWRQNGKPWTVMAIMDETEWGEYLRWIEKLQDQTRPTQTPVLAWRQNGKPWLVMPLLDENEWGEYLRWKLGGKQDERME